MLFLLAPFVSRGGPGPAGRGLTFEQRVEAQRAVSRVYHSHQVGSTRSFHDALPERELEKQVRAYLKQSVLLEQYWRTPITAEALQRELERINRHTLFPDRLRQVYAALGNDLFLIQECFVRPVLAGRLARSFFATDNRIHGEQRAEAERLRALLESGELDIRSEHPGRSIAKLARAEVGGKRIEPSRDRGAHVESVIDGEALELRPLELDARTAEGLRGVGEIGPVEEEQTAFVVRVVLAEADDGIVVATYTITKKPWERWWTEVEQGPPDDPPGEASPVAMAAAGGSMPSIMADSRWGVASRASLPGPDCRPDDTWDNGSLADGPQPRVFHTAVWTGSRMIVWGGNADGGLEYDPLTDTWEAVATDYTVRVAGQAFWTGTEMIVWDAAHAAGVRYEATSQTARAVSTAGAPPPCEATSVWTGSELIVWCGSVGFTGAGGGARYDPETDTWAPMSTVNAPSARGGHAAVWTGSEMIVWGGVQGSYPPLSTGGRYDPTTDVWSPTSTTNAPAFPNPTYGSKAVWTGRVMAAWSVIDLNWDPLFPDGGGLYDPATDSWSPMADNSIAQAPGGTTIWTGKEIIAWGGFDGDGYTPSGARYDPVLNQWTALSEESTPDGRRAHSAVWTGTHMVVWGGWDLEAGRIFHSGGRYDPGTDLWTPTSVGNSGQPPIGQHAAIWTGTEMILWAGSGGRYDPLIDSWRPVSSLGAPPRTARDQQAVWTGTEMLVWSGPTRSQPPQTPESEFAARGGRYDPSSDTWRPISLEGAPLDFLAGTLIWTGQEMIVWGTNSTATCCPQRYTAGRYDPASDSWQLVSTIGAPFPSFNHTAVWTGREMIIWGGRPLPPGFGSAEGRYDPATDSWRSISTTGAPSFGKAVWTGQAMIVWSDPFRFIDPFSRVTGGAYDPISDSWLPIAVSSNTAGVDSPTAVWTGSEMIVWGSSFKIGGARYETATDSWRAVSRVGQPSPREDHSAVWTGRAMIIWGGKHFAEEPLVATGGRLFVGDPDRDQDQDGFTACSGDCDDTEGSINPHSVELPGNTVDENCDGEILCNPDAVWSNRGHLMRCILHECGNLVAQGRMAKRECAELLSSHP